MTASNSPRPASALRLASRSAVLASVLGSVLGSAAGCSVILKPNDDVERCGSADDCSPTGDERYVPICKFDEENTDLDTTKIDKICVADYKSIGCDPSQYTGTSMKNGFKEAAESTACIDLGCAMEDAGKAGCRPSDEGCASGLQVDEDTGFCVDPDADQPTIPAIFLGDSDLPKDQPVRDQFCKSFFCDDTFVCNAQDKCQPCDPDKEYGQGGCGLVYDAGAPAKIYVLGNDLEEQCAEELVKADEPAVFGECS